MSAAVVLGARNLGGAIVDHLLAEGWRAGAVARSDDTLERVRSAGALALSADAAGPGELAGAPGQGRPGAPGGGPPRPPGHAPPPPPRGTPRRGRAHSRPA